MDIKIDRGTALAYTYNEQYAIDLLNKYFSSYPFVNSAKIFFRGDKHPTKKVKIQLRLKGKDLFAKAEGTFHDTALENAVQKLKSQIEKYKSQHYKRG